MLGSNSGDKRFPLVADFYSGKSIFVTGASGFIGAVLLETLLRCCPGIKGIYILLRSKKNAKPEDRIKEIFNKKLFDKIKEENQQLLDKVHVIPGDAALPNLGISDDDARLLTVEVSIVFHCAAIVNFAKPLKFMLENNVLGLHSIIELSRRMKRFEALVYTSTAYSNSNHDKFTLKEEIYRLPFRSEKFLDAMKNEDDRELLKLVEHCKPDWPNTYTFSKCLAENLILDIASDLPTAIIRPSIVFSTWKQPVSGYIEENSGIIALSVGAGKGFVKTVHADPKVKLDLVPADVVVNAHILAACSIGTKRCTPPLVVNCTATENLQVELSEFYETMRRIILKFPLPKSFKNSHNMNIVSNKYLYYIEAAYHHYIPAVVLDVFLKLFGKDIRIYSLYRFFDKTMSSLNFFMFNTFEFERNNLKYLEKWTHQDDKKNFTLDLKDATLLELSSNIPFVSPFYDWKIDKKNPSERKQVKLRRHIIISCIQGMFLFISCMIIFWILSLIL